MCRQKRLQPQRPTRPHPQPLHPPQCLPPSNLHNSFLFSPVFPLFPHISCGNQRTLNSVLETSSYRRFECLSRSHQSQSARFSIFKRLLIFVSSCRSIIHMYILQYIVYTTAYKQYVLVNLMHY